MSSSPTARWPVLRWRLEVSRCRGIHDVNVFVPERRPGGLADAVGAYSDRGENIEVFYLTTEGAVVVGTAAMRKPIHGVRTEDAKYR